MNERTKVKLALEAVLEAEALERELYAEHKRAANKAKNARQDAARTLRAVHGLKAKALYGPTLFWPEEEGETGAVVELRRAAANIEVYDKPTENR